MKDGVADEVLILPRNSREWALGCPGDGGKGQICGVGAGRLAPLFKQAPVAQRDVICRSDTELRRGPVDPFGGALQLRVIADGGFGPWASSQRSSTRSNSSAKSLRCWLVLSMRCFTAASSASVTPGVRASSSMCQRSKLARCWREIRVSQSEGGASSRLSGFVCQDSTNWLWSFTIALAESIRMVALACSGFACTLRCTNSAANRSDESSYRPAYQEVKNKVPDCRHPEMKGMDIPAHGHCPQYSWKQEHDSSPLNCADRKSTR